MLDRCADIPEGVVFLNISSLVVVTYMHLQELALAFVLSLSE